MPLSIDCKCCFEVVNCVWEQSKDPLYQCFGKHVEAWWHLKSNLDNLEGKATALRLLHDALLRHMNYDSRDPETTMEFSVDLWFVNVKKGTDKADQLISEGKQPGNQRSNDGTATNPDDDERQDEVCRHQGDHKERSVDAGVCLVVQNFGRRYCCYPGEVATCLSGLTTAIQEGEEFLRRPRHELVSEVAPEIEWGTLIDCDETIVRTTERNEVLSYLTEKNVRIVGLYGMVGVDTSNLLKQIHNDFVGKKGLLLVWVDREGSNLDAASIQQKIAERCKLDKGDWQQKTPGDKAQAIARKLKLNDFYLFLVDIREKVNLSEIGVPVTDPKCKIIFTTSTEKLCIDMKPQKRLRIDTLEWQDAWKLFQEKVGHDTINSHPVIREHAETLAKRCGGLPLALKVIGENLRCAGEPQEWKTAIEILERTDLQSGRAFQQTIERELFLPLKQNYDNLQSDKYRHCFLSCALLPPGFKISKMDLVALWVCKNFWNHSDDKDIDKAFDEAYLILGALIRVLLLEDGGEWVKLNDVIRAMALWIGRENNMYIMAGQNKNAPTVERWKEMTMVSLMHNRIEELSEAPNCPHIVTLFVSHNKSLRKINQDFFNSMNKLTLLDLSFTGITVLSQSLSGLVSLKYLDISFTQIQELPEFLGNLKLLKYLGLNGLHLKLKTSMRVICVLPSLKVLRMSDCKYCNDDEVETERGKDEVWSAKEEMIVQKLNLLKHVKLAITVSSVSAIVKLFTTQHLKENIQSLCLKDFEDTKLLMSIPSLPEENRLERLEFSTCAFVELPIDAVCAATFKSLTKVNVTRCPGLQDLTRLVLLQGLRDLQVQDCQTLTDIISVVKLVDVGNGPKPFNYLVSVKFEALPQLKCIYPGSLPLNCLKELYVRGCPQLKELPISSDGAKVSKIQLTAEQAWWNAIDAANKAAWAPRVNCTPLSRW